MAAMSDNLGYNYYAIVLTEDCVLETIKGLRKYIGDSYITVLFEYIASIDGGKKLKEYVSF